MKFNDVALLAAHHLSRSVFIKYFQFPRVSGRCLQNNWVKKFKTLTTNPNYVTAGHFQEKLSLLF